MSDDSDKVKEMKAKRQQLITNESLLIEGGYNLLDLLLSVRKKYNEAKQALEHHKILEKQYRMANNNQKNSELTELLEKLKSDYVEKRRQLVGMNYRIKKLIVRRWRNNRILKKQATLHQTVKDMDRYQSLVENFKISTDEETSDGEFMSIEETKNADESCPRPTKIKPSPASTLEKAAQIQESIEESKKKVLQAKETSKKNLRRAKEEKKIPKLNSRHETKYRELIQEKRLQTMTSIADAEAEGAAGGSNDQEILDPSLNAFGFLEVDHTLSDDVLASLEKAEVNAVRDLTLKKLSKLYRDHVATVVEIDDEMDDATRAKLWRNFQSDVSAQLNNMFDLSRVYMARYRGGE
jgi:hypothetical protein